VVAAAATGSPRSHLRPEEAGIAEKEDKIELEGVIVEALRNRMFRLRLDNGHEMIGYTSGKMKRYRIRMLLGDRVRVELSPYDLDRGRIVYRFQ
jgi:translation initiation factor IF-1